MGAVPRIWSGRIYKNQTGEPRTPVVNTSVCPERIPPVERCFTRELSGAGKSFSALRTQPFRSVNTGHTDSQMVARNARSRLIDRLAEYGAQPAWFVSLVLHLGDLPNPVLGLGTFSFYIFMAFPLRVFPVISASLAKHFTTLATQVLHSDLTLSSKK